MNSQKMLLKSPRHGEEYDATLGCRVLTWSRASVFMALAAYLLFAHGCHAEGDHELFTVTVYGVAEESR